MLPALLLLSLHSPRRLWPLWQPTDERSWVYSPLHYSAQLHSVSDEESDTVSVQEARAGCPVGQGRTLRSLCKLALQGELLWPLCSMGLLHGRGGALPQLGSALWQQVRAAALAETPSARQGLSAVKARGSEVLQTCCCYWDAKEASCPLRARCGSGDLAGLRPDAEQMHGC